MSADSKSGTGVSPLDSQQGGLGRLMAHNEYIFAIGLAIVLATLLIPLPTFMLDVLLSCSIATALATLLVVLSTREPIEFSAFPSLLLFVTLFRLSLNVASTRLILVQGDAGAIIHTFGNVVAQGSLVIGVVVFFILVVIQFVVITKGAERISEVAARFNLDAMPGKQMAIDADLNAGMIGEEEARERRKKIVGESEFYGAMDGASKFIRGDAIAGLIITAVNLVGGFTVGMTEGLSAREAVRTYSVLAIGDGLVSQIPAVIISSASGFLISKTSSKRSIGQDLTRQMLARSRPLTMASFLLGAMIFVPGFPKLPLIVLSLGTGLMARTLRRYEREERKKEIAAAEPKPEQAPVEELLDVDKLSVQVGARLIKTVDPKRKGSITNRVAPLRRKFVQEYGFILPLIRIRDDVALEPNTYEIRLHNHVIGTGRLEPEKLLAMDPGTVRQKMEGQPAQEPVFNLPALWITQEQKEKAELAGYTVVDAESVLITHLSEALKRHAHELLSRDDVQQLVDRLSKRQPALVNDVVGDLVPAGLLHRVLQNLLRDGMPIRDLTQILETLGDHAGRTKDPGVLTELVRKALARTITERSADAEGKLPAIVLEPSVELEFCNAISADNGAEKLGVAPERAMELIRNIADAWKEAMEAGRDKVVLLCDNRLRGHLAGMLSRQLPQLPVLAYDEIVAGTPVESLAMVSLEAREAAPAGLPSLTAGAGG